MSFHRVLLGEPPLLGQRLAPGAQHGAVVRARGVRLVQDPQPDVGRPVAHAEHPAVAGEQPVLGAGAVPELEVGLEEVVVAAGTGVVAADRDPQRPVVALADPAGERGPRPDAVARDDQRRGVRGRLALRAPAGRHAHDAAGALVGHGAGDGDPLLDPRTRGPGVVGEHLVEVATRPDEPVGREARQLGPGQLDRQPAAEDPQALVVQPAGLLAGVDAEVDQLLDRPRGEAVPAHLLAGELRLLEHEHVEPGPREVGRRRGAGGAGADDDDVGGAVVAPDVLPGALVVVSGHRGSL